MHVEGNFALRCDRDRVFDFFTDPRRLLDCLDDPHGVEVTDATHFRGHVTTGVAFVRGTFQITGEFTERAPPARATVRLHGRGLGSGIDAYIMTEVTEDAGLTTVRWNADLTFTGPVAVVGERVIRGTVEQKTRALFERARERIEGGE